MDVWGAVIQSVPSVLTKKTIKTGIDAFKNMVLILDFAFTIVPMMDALILVLPIIKIRF